MFLSQVWWCKFVIQALRGLKQEDHKLRKKRRRRREKRKKEGRKEGRKKGRESLTSYAIEYFQLLTKTHKKHKIPSNQ
jgi:hypothetical protein